MQHPKLSYASYRRRAAAFAIDIACLLAGADEVISRLPKTLTASMLVLNSDFLIICIVSTVVLSAFERLPWAATPGKLILGLTVVTASGHSPTTRQILFRNAIKVFTIVYVLIFALHFERINNSLIIAVLLSISTNALWHNFMSVVGGERHGHQLVHDQVAKTEVTHSRPRTLDFRPS